MVRRTGYVDVFCGRFKNLGPLFNFPQESLVRHALLVTIRVWGTLIMDALKTNPSLESKSLNRGQKRRIIATPLLRVKAKITVKNAVCTSPLAAYGEFDCECHYDSQERSCSQTVFVDSMLFLFFSP